MSNSLNIALRAAILRLLRPLVAVLLRHGMPYGTFAELARKAYVEEAFAQGGAGKRPTVSSVSAMTGLTRKETKRLRELDIIDEQDSSRRYSRAIRVVSAWTSDPRFLSARGEPAVLPFDGASVSFATLVKEFSGDIPHAAMLSVLEAGGTVAVSEAGITLLERAYLPSSSTPLDKIDILGTDVAELIATIGHNLTAKPAERCFQRKVSNVLVHPDAVPAFRELSNNKSQELLEEYHRWLTQHELHSNGDSDPNPVYVAVGLYYTDSLVARERSHDA
tara:strand:+ start:16107 stop:16937 length:831 start_codon:yes stop_codon:yes gene_type:complete